MQLKCTAALSISEFAGIFSNKIYRLDLPTSVRKRQFKEYSEYRSKDNLN